MIWQHLLITTVLEEKKNEKTNLVDKAFVASKLFFKAPIPASVCLFSSFLHVTIQILFDKSIVSVLGI